MLSQNNESFGNQYGYSAGAGSTSVGNRIHDNTAIGVTTRGNAGIATLIGNTIFNNPIGIDVYVTEVTLQNNLFYGNTQNAIYAEFTDRLQIESNTIDQTGGTAIRSSTNSTNISLKNNIIHVGSNGKAFDIAAQGEPSFTSDWDLFSLDSGATMGLWGWALRSAPSTTGGSVPGSTSTALGAILYSPTWRTHNYLLQPTSPGIDAGDPDVRVRRSSPAIMGAASISASRATPQRPPRVPLRLCRSSRPNGLDKLTDGTPVTITFRTDGVSGLRPIVLLNSAGPAIPGTTMGTNWQVGPDPERLWRHQRGSEPDC